MPPPKRGQASFAKKKVEVDPEEEKRKKAEYDAAQKKKRLEAAKRFSVGGTVDLDLLLGERGLAALGGRHGCFFRGQPLPTV